MGFGELVFNSSVEIGFLVKHCSLRWQKIIKND